MKNIWTKLTKEAEGVCACAYTSNPPCIYCSIVKENDEYWKEETTPTEPNRATEKQVGGVVSGGR